MEQFINKTANTIESFIKIFLILSLAIITFSVTLEVICRSFFNYSNPWVEELARFLLVWLCFLGASTALWHDELVDVEVFVVRLPLKAQIGAYFVKQLGILLLLYTGMISGWALMMNSFKFKQVSSSLLLEMSYIYIVLPLGFALMIVYTLLKILRIIFIKKERQKVFSKTESLQVS